MPIARNAGVRDEGELVEVDAEFCGGGDTEVGLIDRLLDGIGTWHR